MNRLSDYEYWAQEEATDESCAMKYATCYNTKIGVEIVSMLCGTCPYDEAQEIIADLADRVFHLNERVGELEKVLESLVCYLRTGRVIDHRDGRDYFNHSALETNLYEAEDALSKRGEV